jgi:hypothetical protein
VALDRWSLPMIAPWVKGRHILCLGYPDLLATILEVEAAFGVSPRKWSQNGEMHGVSRPIPETIDTLMLAGALSVDCVDIAPTRGVERVVDLNEKQVWPREYGLVINPGTTEHCFDIATATFNAWRAVEVGGALLNVAPLSMVNHGFYNICPTMIMDFAEANGGKVEQFKARDRNWNVVKFDPVRRCRVEPESVMYCLIIKESAVPETIPAQWRYKNP